MHIIDSHQHFWKYDAVRDAWITEEMAVLQRDFLPSELAGIYQEEGIAGCVAVQADQSLYETLFLVGLAAEHDFIRGVVGWVDFRADNIHEELEKMVSFPVVKGFRHIIQAENADVFLQNEKFCQGIGLLAQFDFTYDLLVYARQLPAARRFVHQFPHQAFVLDHGGKPDIRSIIASGGKVFEHEQFICWKNEIDLLAQFPNVCCKLSGFITEADWGCWTKEDITPFVDVLLEAFGPSRLMVGSDWPVCLLAAKAEEHILYPVSAWVEQLSINEQQQIYSGTATSFYRLY